MQKKRILSERRPLMPEQVLYYLIYYRRIVNLNALNLANSLNLDHI